MPGPNEQQNNLDQYAPLEDQPATISQKPLLKVSDVDAHDIGPDEKTILNPSEEKAFQKWAQDNKINEPDHPNHFYDYRGAFLADEGPDKNGHWTDKFKQHGHPSFSEESQYSTGPGDGGTWVKGKFVPATKKLDIGTIYIHGQPTQPGSINVPQTELSGIINQNGPDNLRVTVPGIAPNTPLTPQQQQQVNQDKAATLAADKKVEADNIAAAKKAQQEEEQRRYGLLNPTQFARNQLDKLEQRKGLEVGQANNLSEGQANQANILGQGADVEQQKIREEEQRKAQSAAEMARAQQDIHNRYEDIRAQIKNAMAQKIDPNHFWNSKSTEGKILAGIGMALGGFSSGILHQDPSKSPAIMMINNAIEADINAQKSNIENSWKAIKEQTGLADNEFNSTMHAQTFKNWQHISELEVVKMKVAQAQTATQSQTVKYEAGKLLQDLEQQQDVLKNNLWQQAMAAAGAGAAKREKDSLAAEKEIATRVDGLIEKGIFKTTEDAMEHIRRTTPDLVARAGSRAPQGFNDNKLLVQQGAAIMAIHDKVRREQFAAGLSEEASERAAQAAIKNLPGGQNAVNAYIKYAQDTSKPYPVPNAEKKETPGELQNRTVILDGKPAQAISIEAAKKWDEHARAADQVRAQYEAMIEAHKTGNYEKYQTARGLLIEAAPGYIGYARGPSEAQVKSTFGESIPIWDRLNNFTKINRVDPQLEQVGNFLNGYAKNIRIQTFGASVAPGPNVYTPSTYPTPTNSSKKEIIPPSMKKIDYK